MVVFLFIFIFFFYVFYCMFFFFFQAEDGIRDIGVTGVQTCALPISGRGEKRRPGPAPRRRTRRCGRFPRPRSGKRRAAARPARDGASAAAPRSSKIGRASCRERV